VYNEHKDSDGLVLLSPAPVGTDPTTQIASNYRVLGIPTHVFIDRDGIIRDMRVGAMSKKTMEKKVAMIAETASP
jgi:hypothetical protein